MDLHEQSHVFRCFDPARAGPSLSWNHSADEIWRSLGLELWELTGNPWVILQSISQEKLDRMQPQGAGLSWNMYVIARCDRGGSWSFAAATPRRPNVLDADTLTLGFARRFATYKRPTLLLQDPNRLARLLTNPQRPAQLVVAGKAHPKDMPGQELIRGEPTSRLRS